jgi:hypothetical protein
LFELFAFVVVVEDHVVPLPLVADPLPWLELPIWVEEPVLLVFVWPLPLPVVGESALPYPPPQPWNVFPELAVWPLPLDADPLFWFEPPA